MSVTTATGALPQRRRHCGNDGPLPCFYLITCEHGGNRIPAHYLALFQGGGDLLRTHRGYDMGALRLAREFARALSAPLQVSTVSRLLVDLNRSLGHPRLFSDATRRVAPDVRQQIVEDYYLPYRTRAETQVAQAIDAGMRVIHISCHSFTPELDGKVRHADIGLLYDPARAGEAEICRRWKAALNVHAPSMKTRLNYPYSGTSDGFTVYLRRHFPADRYVGIEIEINQKHVRTGGSHWKALRESVLASFQEVIEKDRTIGRADVVR